MGTQATPPAADLPRTHTVPVEGASRRSQPAHAGSLWFDLTIALVAGLLYALIVIGPSPLNPRNVDWVTVDPAYHYVGWELWRQDPHVHWPLTYTGRLGYPKGESIALVDLNPLLAVLLRPFSPLLGEPFQYFGLEVVLACALQFFFAFRIFRLVLGTNVLGVALCSVFFLLAPPLNYRLMQHYSLSNQWLILAALYLFFRVQLPTQPKKGWMGRPSSNAIRQFVISGTVLAGVAVGINPYIAFQVVLLLVTGIASLLWQRRVTALKAAGIAVLFWTAGFLVAYSLGLVIEGGRGYTTGGYRVFSMNLLSLNRSARLDIHLSSPAVRRHTWAVRRLCLSGRRDSGRGDDSFWRGSFAPGKTAIARPALGRAVVALLSRADADGAFHEGNLGSRTLGGP